MNKVKKNTKLNNVFNIKDITYNICKYIDKNRNKRSYQEKLYYIKLINKELNNNPQFIPLYL